MNLASWRLWAGMGALSALAGCAGNGEVRRQAADVRSQCDAAYAASGIDPVREKILLPIVVGQPQPVEILADTSFAAAEEKAAIRAVADAFATCNDAVVRAFGEAPLYRRATNATIADHLEHLADGDISYGRFADALLRAGERDQLARADVEADEAALRRWRQLQEFNGN